MPSPSRLVRSTAAVALAISATGLAYVGSAAPARAAGYNGYCTSSSGVTVVVDFGRLGGGIAIRCSPVGSGASGIDALQKADIPVLGTQRYGLSTPCRIYGKPTSDPCVNMPPTTGYWSYWHAPNGGQWSYSSEGPLSRTVIPGGFEGWRFSNGNKVAPGAAPRRPASNPAPKPAPSHSSTAAAPAPGRHTTKGAPPPGSSSGGSHSSSTAGSHSSTSGPHSSSSSASKTPSGSTSSSAVAAGSSSGSTAVAAGGAQLANSDNLINQADKSSGVNATTIVGGILLAVLAIGGGTVAIIRRRSLGQ